jgi:hypothetical protein
VTDEPKPPDELRARLAELAQAIEAHQKELAEFRQRGEDTRRRVHADRQDDRRNEHDRREGR